MFLFPGKDFTRYTCSARRIVNQPHRRTDEWDMNRVEITRPAPASRAGTLILLAVLLCLALAAAETTALADQITCSACGKTIQGEYLVLEGEVYCSQDCLDTVLPRCTVCGEVIRGRHLTLEGRHYCNRGCLARDLPACNTCGRPVDGNYYESKDKTYCSESLPHLRQRAALRRLRSPRAVHRTERRTADLHRMLEDGGCGAEGCRTTFPHGPRANGPFPRPGHRTPDRVPPGEP